MQFTADNLWLSHAARDRVASRDNRTRWMGRDGEVANTVFVDGVLKGLWRVVDGELEFDLFRTPSRSEQVELDDERDRTRSLLQG